MHPQNSAKVPPDSAKVAATVYSKSSAADIFAWLTIADASHKVQLTKNTTARDRSFSADLLPPTFFQIDLGSDAEQDFGSLIASKVVIANRSSSVENAFNASRLEDLRRRFSSDLLQALRQEAVEPGILGPADSIVRTCLDQNALVTVTWISELFLTNFDRPAVAADLLMLVSRLPYAVANPVGMTMALAGLNHKNGAVQEAAIRCFEHWATPDSLKILQNVRIEPKWLRDYVLDVINDLKASCDDAG